MYFFAGKELEVMKEKGEKVEELEIKIQKLERDNDSLQKKVSSLGIVCEKVNSAFSLVCIFLFMCLHTLLCCLCHDSTLMQFFNVSCYKIKIVDFPNITWSRKCSDCLK